MADSCLQTDGRDPKSSAGALKVGKVNVDEQPRLAELAGVLGIPSVVLYRDGAPSARAIGAQPKRLLEQTLGLDEQLAATDAG